MPGCSVFPFLSVLFSFLTVLSGPKFAPPMVIFLSLYFIYLLHLSFLSLYQLLLAVVRGYNVAKFFHNWCVCMH